MEPLHLMLAIPFVTRHLVWGAAKQRRCQEGDQWDSWKVPGTQTVKDKGPLALFTCTIEDPGFTSILQAHEVANISPRSSIQIIVSKFYAYRLFPSPKIGLVYI